MDTVRPFVERTNAKLRYAAVHLGELRTYKSRGSGDEFERAHHESFLFHLLGARDAFLQELNLHYGCDLGMDKVTAVALREKMKASGEMSPELEQLSELERDPQSWLSQAKTMRDHATHRTHIARTFHVALGSPDPGTVHLKDPRSGGQSGVEVIEQFEMWLTNMQDLLNALRTSAQGRSASTT